MKGIIGQLVSSVPFRKFLLFLYIILKSNFCFFLTFQSIDSGDESDPDMHEWENQQIRKGVTGAQLVSAQQESILYSQYLIKSGPDDVSSSILSTGNLLEQAYAKHSLDKPRQLLKSTQRAENKPTGPRMPEEVFKKMNDRLIQVKELNAKHLSDIERIGRDLKLIKMEELECEQNAPLAASKFRFYQELREYCHDLIECLDEKVGWLFCDILFLLFYRQLIFKNVIFCKFTDSEDC